MERISRDSMFMDIAEIVALRGTCPRAQVGAVIVKDKHIVSCGYNGAPSRMPHCDEVGCETPDGLTMKEVQGGLWIIEDPKHPKDDPPIALSKPPGCRRSIHAESNAIAWAARAGISVKGATMYATYSPCYDCAKMILSSGIAELKYLKTYRAERLDILLAGDVEVTKYV